MRGQPSGGRQLTTLSQKKKPYKDRPLGGLADALVKAGLAEPAPAPAARRADAPPASLQSVREAIRAHAELVRGGRRWYFVARDERVLFLDVSEAATKLLAEGRAGIVENVAGGAEEHVLVTSREALALALSLDPELVRFWNGRDH